MRGPDRTESRRVGSIGTELLAEDRVQGRVAGVTSARDRNYCLLS